MTNKLLSIALLVALVLTSCGSDNSNYIDCGTYNNLVRETLHKNKVKTITGIDVLSYDYENEKHKDINDTSSVKRYDELGNKIESKTRYYEGRFHLNFEYEYDRYGRKEYSISSPPLDYEVPVVEHIHFYEDETTCKKSYSLVYKNGGLKDSISHEYSNDTVFSKVYELNTFNQWKLDEINEKIVDKQMNVLKKNIQRDLEKEYEFSSDHKLLSVVTKSKTLGEPSTTKHEFSYNEDGLMTESNFYRISDDVKLVSTTKYYYEFY